MMTKDENENKEVLGMNEEIAFTQFGVKFLLFFNWIRFQLMLSSFSVAKNSIKVFTKNRHAQTSSFLI